MYNKNIFYKYRIKMGECIGIFCNKLLDKEKICKDCLVIRNYFNCSNCFKIIKFDITNLEFKCRKCKKL